MIKPFCGLCGSIRISHPLAQPDKRCKNPECSAYDVAIYFDMGIMYDMLLEINRLAKND